MAAPPRPRSTNLRLNVLFIGIYPSWSSPANYFTVGETRRQASSPRRRTGPQSKIGQSAIADTRVNPPLAANARSAHRRIGPAIARACADTSKPRKRDRDPMMIEVGSPLADK